jgi:hypothetical protein
MGMARTRELAVLVFLVAGCKAAQPLPELSGGAELALRRGAAWSTVKVRPPYAIGPRVNLHFNHNKVSGQLDPGQMMDTRLGALSLTIDDEGISGSGPYGDVAIDVSDQPNVLVFDGTWNGSRVNFTITDQSFRGTVPIRRFGATNSVSGVSTCQYVLDKVTADGAREGTSICGGLPEETRLEVPRQAQAWLTKKELIVVLLALLSTPPQTSLEPLP